MRCRAYGLELEPRFSPPGLRAVEGDARPALRIALARPDEIAADWIPERARPIWGTRFADGREFRLEVGAGGDHRAVYGSPGGPDAGHLATFHLDAAGTELRCAPREPAALGWQRVLLDTMLTCASLLAGFQGLHAGSVAGPAGAVAILAATGGGKSTLAAELVHRGWSLVSDDILVLSRSGHGILAHPGPAVMNQPATGRVRAIGVELERFGDETWVEVARVVTTPQPLRAVFLLDRWADPEAVRAEPTVLDLLPHALGLPGGDRRAEFDLLGELAATVPVHRLRSGLDVSAAALADVVQRAVPGLEAAA